MFCGLTRTIAIGLVVMLGGCAPDNAGVLAGLPDDFARLRPSGSSVEPASPGAARFDGYYQGALASAGSACPGMRVQKPIPRDMLVRDGSAAFGVNLPFSGVVAQDGTAALHDSEFGALTGQFAGADFSGTLEAGPGCQWLVRLHRVDEPPPPDPVQPQPVDTPGPFSSDHAVPNASS